MNQFNVALVVLILFWTTVTQAKRCVTTGTLPGHTAVVEAHFARNWPEMAKQFKKVCDDNKTKISCQVIPAEKSQAEEKMKSLAKSRPCAEILNATEANPPVLYVIDERDQSNAK